MAGSAAASRRARHRGRGHIGRRAAVRRRLPGAVALEGGERSALVRGDPDVDHRVLATGVHRARRAPALGVGDSDDLRLSLLVERPAQVLVHVPLHQRPAPVDQFGVVDLDVLGDEHGRHQGALLAVDLVHERLGSGRVEERVVADVADVDEVLEARCGVADGPVADSGSVVTSAKAGRSRSVLAARVSAAPAVDGDTVDTGEVDRCRRSQARGQASAAGSVSWSSACTDVAAWELGVLGGFLRRWLEVWLCASSGTGGLIVAGDVRGAGHHRDQAERAERHAGRDEVARRRSWCAGPGRRRRPRQRALRAGAHGVGEPATRTA